MHEQEYRPAPGDAIGEPVAVEAEASLVLAGGSSKLWLPANPEAAMARQLLRRTLNGSLLGQMLDDPQLAPQLRALPAPVLRQVILQIGLEDAGELVALSSLEQLR